MKLASSPTLKGNESSSKRDSSKESNEKRKQLRAKFEEDKTFDLLSPEVKKGSIGGKKSSMESKKRFLMRA